MGPGRSWTTEIAQLPADCRPQARLVFDLNSHEDSVRVDVTPEGLIRQMAGAQGGKGWLSLSGISFLHQDPRPA